MVLLLVHVQAGFSGHYVHPSMRPRCPNCMRLHGALVCLHSAVTTDKRFLWGALLVADFWQHTKHCSVGSRTQLWRYSGDTCRRRKLANSRQGLYLARTFSGKPTFCHQSYRFHSAQPELAPRLRLARNFTDTTAISMISHLQQKQRVAGGRL